MQYPKLVESKISANQVTTIEWNPGMDLLATVFDNGALTCSRLLSLQKVWHQKSDGKIISIAWRPDGRILAIGCYNKKTKENICSLHDVENGEIVYSITKTKAITSVAWYQYVPTDEIKEKEGKKFKNIWSPFEAEKEKFSHQLAHNQSHLNILMISTEDGKISFYALGLFYLGDVTIHSDPCSKIVKTHMSSCLRYITSVISTKNQSFTSSSIKVLKLDTFYMRSDEILRVAKMYAKITDELEYIDDTINAISTSWVDVLAGLDNKLSSYCSRKNRKSNLEQDGYTFLSADELLQLLVMGFTSDNLEKFLTDMSDKGLKKLNAAIEQTCQRIQNLIVKNAQKCCYHLHADLNILRGMSQWRERYQDVGLDDKFIVEAMKSIGSLLLKLTEMQQVIDHSLRSTKSFFRWLISIAHRMTGEQTNSVVPNDINKTTQQDVQLITDFILENFDYNSNQDELGTSLSCQEDSKVSQGDILSNRPTCSNFTLEQVGQYLKNEPLSRLKYSFAKPKSNFWIEFFKQYLESSRTKCLDEDGSSVLLFYPHNHDTSLIQEHRGACKSIEGAFISVADNLKLVLKDSENSINLKDFIKSELCERVRIETDIKAMHHYVLFQTKQEPVARQYLLSQSLLDRNFRIISIEFRTLPENQSGHSSSKMSPPLSAHNLPIVDSSFYENKETRKFLLTFLLLDQDMGDTLIVQTDLNKLVERSNCSYKNPRDLTKVFRNNDSIDKQSSHVIIELDIYSEPARERRLPSGLMVKKIKNTIGRDMFSSSGRGVIAFTSCENKRLHLYELETLSDDPEFIDDEIEGDEKIDESLIDTDLIG